MYYVLQNVVYNLTTAQCGSHAESALYNICESKVELRVPSKAVPMQVNLSARLFALDH